MARTGHPKIRPPRKLGDRIFEFIAVGALVFGFILVIWGWGTLPNTIPIHFNAKGDADGFGPKGLIWLSPIISVAMVPLLLWLRRFPWLSNVPIRITVENAEYQYGLIVRLLSLLACFVSLLFLVLVHDTISIVGGGTSLLGWGFMPIFLSGWAGPIIWYLFAALKGR